MDGLTNIAGRSRRCFRSSRGWCGRRKKRWATRRRRCSRSPWVNAGSTCCRRFGQRCARGTERSAWRRRCLHFPWLNNRGRPGGLQALLLAAGWCHWHRVSLADFTKELLRLATLFPMNAVRKAIRGPKEERPPKTANAAKKHVSTQRILAENKAKSARSRLHALHLQRAHQTMRTAIGFTVLLGMAGLNSSCGECPPVAGPCLFVYVRNATTGAPVPDAVPLMVWSNGETRALDVCSMHSLEPDRNCFTVVGFGCTGTFTLRVTHQAFAPFEQRVTAPPGREFECMQARYRVGDVRKAVHHCADDQIYPWKLQGILS